MALKVPRVQAHASVQQALDFIARQFPLGPQQLADSTRGALLAFTAATLPDEADYEGRIIYVSDGGAGTRFRGSDGTAWVNLG